MLCSAREAAVGDRILQIYLVMSVYSSVALKVRIQYHWGGYKISLKAIVYDNDLKNKSHQEQGNRETSYHRGICREGPG